VRVEFLANLVEPDVDPGTWAATREAEGWDAVAVADHYFLDNGGTQLRWYPHLWVAASQMAAATERVQLSSSFANNLFRSPIEFVQASLTMQRVSGGRWNAGLGAGWARAEMDSTGQVYPAPRQRADRYIEAIKVVRQLFDTGQCVLEGEHYNINVPECGGFEDVTPPPLIGSLAGPRTIAGGTPYLDWVELMPAMATARNGNSDGTDLATIPKTRLVEMIDQVRRVKEDVKLCFGAVCGIGDDPMSQFLTPHFTEDSLYGGLFGSPEKVAENLRDLESYGISRVSIVTADPHLFEKLAPLLFESRN
jgi:alkanesulfonate monooxygenase SsuD/methylene tetrahydromethanopterin reductase-like flavin-dependent oxidoreductase (luciferase family)